MSADVCYCPAVARIVVICPRFEQQSPPQFHLVTDVRKEKAGIIIREERHSDVSGAFLCWCQGGLNPCQSACTGVV
jgi:hypothetical protein